MAEAKVLIVEDNATVRQAYSKFLLTVGFEVCQAGSFDEAVELLDESIDIALLDIQLGDKSGLDILARMRTQLPDCPAIMMSGFADKKNAIEALDHGAVEYLEKPVNPQSLVKCIRHWLSMRELKQKNQHLQAFEANYQKIQECEQRVERSREQLNLLLNATSSMLYTADRHWHTSSVSDNSAALFGYDATACTNDPNFLINCVHPDDKSQLIAERERIVKLGKGQVTYRLRHQQGHYIKVRDYIEVKLHRHSDIELMGCISCLPTEA